MGEQKCLFCDQKALYSGEGPLDQYFKVECPNCGVYFVSDQVINLFDFNQIIDVKHLISGLIREKNDLGLRNEIITYENITSLADDPMIPRTIMQKLDKVLLFFYRNTKSFGDAVKGEYLNSYSRGYAKTSIELSNMVQAIVRSGYVRGDLTLTIEGMKRAEMLIVTNTHSTKVFVAMGFKPDLIDAHKKAIQPACEECGFDAKLIIETEHNDDITDRIIAEIKTSKFMITDFTYNNQGAYFEAGYAQGRGLPVIRTCRKDWFDGIDEKGEKNRLHFDINHYNFILWEDYDDLKEKLINRIKATIL